MKSAGLPPGWQRFWRDTWLRQQLVEIMEELYDLGRVREVYEIFGGYINRSYGLVVQRDGIRKDYFLRKYKPGIAEHEINSNMRSSTTALPRGSPLPPG